MSIAARHFDVVIIGAGMVGASLALALRQHNPVPPRTLLVEASDLHANRAPTQPGFDARSTVLSAGSVYWFREFGLWPALAGSAEPIHHIHVSDQGHFGSVRLDSSVEGVDALGHVVENAVLGHALNEALFAAAGLELSPATAVVALKPTPGGMHVVLHRAGGDETVSADLVVLAEGGRSTLCTDIGISRRVQDYGQSAVIANVAFTRPHRGWAWERFTTKGPLALLPLPDHAGQPRAALVWTHAAAGAEHMLAVPDADFLQALQQDFGPRVGTFTRVGRRACYPLALQIADEQIRPGLVLLGNVAHTLHPVAGQGFNLALRDTLALARNIRESLALGQKPGSFVRLQAYAAAVRADQTLTIGFSDYMTRLFSSSSPALALVRKLGMASIDLLPPLKRQLSRQAMGLGSPRAVLE